MNQSLQHDAAMQAMREVMEQLKTDLPFERRLSVMQLLYFSFKAALERYEESVERRECTT